MIDGYMDKRIPYQRVLAMPQATRKSIIHADLDITPSLHLYDYESDNRIPVEICNITTRTVAVPPRAVLCELQPVELLNTQMPETLTSTPELQHIYERIKLSPTISEKEEHQCKDLIAEFSNVFSTKSTDLGTTDKVKHRIELNDATPFKQKYGRIPPATIEEVRTHIQELIPVRIRVRIDPPHPLVCRKRRLNREVLRMRPEKPRPRVTAGVAR
jgi:hypothetical protein